MEQAIMATHHTYTIWKYIVAGFLAGLITAALNNILFFFLPMLLNFEYPLILDEMALSLGSFFPPIIATIFYYFVSSKNYEKGTKVYISLVMIGFLISIGVQFFPEQLINTGFLQAGDIPHNLALITVPFHVTTALVALIFIPKFVGSKED